MNWYWILGWLPSIFAILGNGVVIYLICTRSRLKNVPNHFVLSLALADLGVGACCFPVQLICSFNATNCRNQIADDIAVLMIYSSNTNLCPMTIDRYLAIVLPLTYTSLMTTRRARYLIAFSWCAPLFSYFIPALCTSLHGCTINVNITVIVWTSMFEFVPCVLLLTATTKIIITARRHCRQLAKMNNQLQYNQPNHKGQTGVSSARVIGTVVAIFIACYALEVYSSLCHFTKFCGLTKDLSKAVFFLVVTNSAANPFAYALFKRDIKRELKKIFCKWRSTPAAGCSVSLSTRA
ncbi:adenosine receptor A2a-like [Stylophora pistillata]|uniref:adenosine receptor A2a-like n=1 Tax=Stylophora pistillata TaxID=50429 RepID=UPI000C051A75|nr:adenosine receptor A2a-like [Stylophora pistillata]